MSPGRLDELPERTFAPNDATRELVRGKDATLGHFVDHQINKPKWDAWKALPEAVRTGQVAFAVAHGGLDMHQVRSSLLETRLALWLCCSARAPHQSASFCLRVTSA